MTKLMSCLLVFLLCLLVLSQTVSARQTKWKKIRRAKTYRTQYRDLKRKYCRYDGFDFLPGAIFYTFDGCSQCKCTEKALECRRMSQRYRKKNGCRK